MAKLSKVNKYAVLWLNSQGHDTDTISKDLKLSIKQVESVVSEHKPISAPPTTQVAARTAKDFMIRHSQNNVNNVSIMTQQASMIADEARKSLNNNQTSPFYIKKS